MSGIFAWWHDKKTDDEINFKALQIKNTLQKRGEGKFLRHGDVIFFVWKGQKLCLSDDKSIVAMVDGNFYNKKNNENGDELINLYEKYGENAIKHLNGEFVFVLWDKKRQKIWSGRDGAGGRMVCYMTNEKEVVFSTEGKVLIKGGWSDKINDRALMQSLSMQYTDPDLTFFENVYQVKPGGEVKIKKVNNKWVKHDSIWFEWFEGGEYKDQEIVNEEFDYWFSKSVKQRVENGKVCVHLSGGCDSTAVLIKAMEYSNKVHPYTVRFLGGTGHDESDIAKQSAKRLGIDLNEVEVGVEDIFSVFSKAVKNVERFAINGHLSAKYLLNEKVHEDNIKTCISGEGSDEAMLGYPFFTDKIDEKILSRNKISIGSMLSHGDNDRELNFKLSGERPLWLRAKQGIGYRMHQMMEDDYLYENKKYINEFGVDEKFNQIDPIHRSSAMWARYALGGYILPALANGVEAGFSINGKIPFLDMDFLRVSGKWSRKNVIVERNKEIINKAPLRDYLIKNKMGDVANRAKHPFEAPPILSCSKTRDKCRELFMDEKTWYNTPMDIKKVQNFVSEWDRMDEWGYQRVESVVCLMLSVYFLTNEFNLR